MLNVRNKKNGDMMFFKKNDNGSEFTVKYGREMDISDLEKVYELDVMVYDESMCGKLENMVARFEYEPDSFICIMRDGELIGYINFFPVSHELHTELFAPECTVMRDDDIKPEEVSHYYKDQTNDLFILSVVVRREYRRGAATRLLGEKFAEFIAEKHQNGYAIGDISGATISADGRRFLSKMHFISCKALDEGHELYVCTDKQLEELINDGKKCE